MYLHITDTLLVPIFSFICCVLTSILVVYLISFATTVSTFAPIIMVSLGLALSVDYNLFLLSRFREEVLKQERRFAAEERSRADWEVEEEGRGQDQHRHIPVARAGDLDFPLRVREAVVQMLKVPGHTVLTSGVTLMICLFALAPIPVDVLNSMGLGAGIVTFMAVLVNLTMTPCILLLWPNFFSDVRCSRVLLP